MRFAIFYFNPFFKGIKMSQSDYTQFNSISDLGYKQAVTGDTLRVQAKYALDVIVGFPEEINKTDKATLFAGYQLRYAEINPKVDYVVIDGNYHRVDDLNDKMKEKIDKLERIQVGVDFAMSFSQQQFGALRESEPNKHALVKIVRDKFNTYASNKLGTLKSEARKYLNEGKSRERGATKSFADRVDITLADMKDKCKTANARGDTTADSRALGIAIEAFLNAWTTR
jgi:hypothetical protein